MSPRIFALGAATLALVLPAAAMAEPHGNHGANHGNHATAEHGGHGASSRDAGRACPPGLAKKNLGCVPPGQWKKGQRLPDEWSRYYTPYDSLPDYYRNRYEVNSGYRYIYRDSRVFVIDAVTRAIVDILAR